MERWVAEIRLRATLRIGEISAGLEVAKPLNGKGSGLPTGGKTKTATLKAAGLSHSVAQRAETLAGKASQRWDAFQARRVDRRLHRRRRRAARLPQQAGANRV